jgi:hypothetical protein
LIDLIDIHKTGIKEKIKTEVERVKKFNSSLRGIKEKVIVDNIDIKNYTKFILEDGWIWKKEKF